MKTPLSIGLLSLSLCTAALAQERRINVASDGSGDYRTLQEAIAAVPDNSADRTVIHLKDGTYEGPFLVDAKKAKLTLEGEASGTTILTYDKNVNDHPKEQQLMQFDPCLGVKAPEFHAEKLTIRNTSGDHGQALALRIDADRAVVRDCRILGWQDTLMINNGRQFFKDCYIEGRVDFIYGSGRAWFENCEIHSKAGGYLTAASTPQEQPYGFVFSECRITGDDKPWVDPSGQIPGKKPGDPRAFLGRPWRDFASVTFMNCAMGEFVRPEGWHNWGKPEKEKTARYSEFGNTGPGSSTDKRVPWSKQLTKEEASMITKSAVIGGSDNWKPE